MRRREMTGIVRGPGQRDTGLARPYVPRCRLYGDAAEAGRWMYLEEDRNTDEAAAFEARYGSPG